MQGWTTGRTPLADVVEDQNDKCLKVYREDADRILEDANNEQRIATGGYSTRQLEELTQNAVDAARSKGSRVEIILSNSALYVANDGEPFSEGGVRAVMASDISSKRSGDDVGRFGIGFKSVLAVSETPRVYSRSVSFGFDRDQAEDTLRRAGFEAESFPTMRLAQIIEDPAADAAGDGHLADAMAWASTVVMLPLDTWAVRQIAARLDQFPVEFVLFSTHVRQAALRNLSDYGKSGAREISTTVTPERTVLLTLGKKTAEWSVATAKGHAPSEKALKDGSYAAARAKVDVSYAVNLSSTGGLGTFWSYFPTGDQTTLSGIINAPWKLNDDRRRLLHGAFNEEILVEVVPPLVVKALQAFDGRENVASILDTVPARGRESRSVGDDAINAPVIRVLRESRSLPNGAGRLAHPSKVSWLGDSVPVSWLQEWADFGGPVEKWVHPGVYVSSTTLSKVRRLKGEDPQGQGAGIAKVDSYEKWLEDLLGEGTVEDSARAIRFAAWLYDQAFSKPAEGAKVREALKRARIVRLEDGTLKPALKGKVFVRVEGQEGESATVDFVDPELVRLPGVKAALNTLGVVLMDRTGELHELLSRARQVDALRDPALVWPKIWEILREIPEEAGLRILREDLECQSSADLILRTRVKSAAGKWVSPGQAYLAGAIVPVDKSRDRDRLIDPVYHRYDIEKLQQLGAVAAPAYRAGMPEEPWARTYLEAQREIFLGKQGGRSPQREYIELEGGSSDIAWPMEPLLSMSDEARAAATKHLLATSLPGNKTAYHRTDRSYTSVPVLSPEAWFIRRHGLLETSHGVRRPGDVLLASDDIDKDIFPAYETSAKVAAAIGLRGRKAGLDDLTDDDWISFKKTVDTWLTPDADERRTRFYAQMLGYDLEIKELAVRVGRRVQIVPLENIGVTHDAAVYEGMLEAEVPALLVPAREDVERLTEGWGMPAGENLLQVEIVHEPAGEPEYLTDVFPPLKLRLAFDEQEIRIQPCSSIDRMNATPQGQRATPLRQYREGDVVLVSAQTQEQQLQQVSAALNLGMTQQDIDKVFADMKATEVNKLRQAVKKVAAPADKLLLAVGAGQLRRVVPGQAIEVLEQRPGGVTDREIAELACSVHGIGILKALSLPLEEAGLQPPREWAGRRHTRDWVVGLGFPAEWAGFASAARPAVEIIDGPARLQPLHDYQEKVTQNITALLRDIGPDRGMVSLPTGAGKTRVTVQALVDAVRGPEGDGSVDGDLARDKPIVWIAQTDELCEQAAETWSYIWRALGPQIPMRLGRLWAANSVSEEPGMFQVVIATVQKLTSVKDQGGTAYEWLRDPSVVVIDEAHTSTATSYTQVLEWLGRAGRGRTKTDRKPLLGLTATPFRGTSVFETERLVGRYDNNRLDRGAFRNDDNAYGELQERKILAEVRHELIDGTDVVLSQDEIATMEKFGAGRLPQSVEARLGESLERTMRLVDHIAAQPEDWTILAFTPSVENARVLAALLSHRGVRAVSVDASTDPAARRHYVEQFKKGEIRVLTNYNIFTQGFDAPKVKAVYVARPTFSPNVYQQMIGRGLRGPKNGGSEEVTIVNVQDNFNNYGEHLAFTEFEYLWDRDRR